MARLSHWYVWFYLQKWGNFEPLYLSNKSKFWKNKSFLVYDLRNVSQQFLISAMIRKYRSGQAEQLVFDCIESTFWKKKWFLVYGFSNVSQKCRTSAIVRKYRRGQADNFWFWYPKVTFFRVFFAVFSCTGHELMVPAKPRNTYSRPHLIQKEPTDYLNFSRRWTILVVQNVTLYYKIDIVIQLFWWLYKWSLAKGYTKHSTPCFYFQQNPRYQLLKNRLLPLSVLQHINNAHCRARYDTTAVFKL